MDLYNKHIDFSFFIFCPTQDPDNVIFVMDATIGQACEAQVNMMNQPLLHTHTLYLKKYKVYKTSCPANSYNANLGRTRL